MAIGDIGASLIDSLVYSSSAVQPAICHAIGDIYVLAYTHPTDLDGYFVTVTIDSDGNIPDAVEDTLEFDTDYGAEVCPIKVADGVIAIAYRGTDSDGFVKTFGIGSDGTISGEIDSLEFDTDQGFDPDIIHISGDVYAIAYEHTLATRQGMVATITIDSAGNIGASVIDTLIFDASTGYRPSIVHISGDYYAIAYTGVGSDGWIVTVEIDTSGNIADTVIDSLEFDETYTTNAHALLVHAGIVAIAYTGENTDGFIKTVDIDSSGDIGSVQDTEEFDTVEGKFPKLISLGDDVVAVVYVGDIGEADGWIKTYPIDDTGAIGTLIDSQEFHTVDVSYTSIIHVSGHIYALSFEAGTAHGVAASTIDIETLIVGYTQGFIL